MVLAHSFSPGGPDIELLAISGVLLVLGVVLFVQRSVKPVVSIILVLGALAVATGAFAFATPSPGSSDAQLSINSPRAGAVVDAGTQLSLDVTVTGGRLASSSSSTTEGGHLHVFIDGRLVSMPSSRTPKVRLKPGGHELAVEYVGPTHVSFNPKVIAQVDVEAE